MHRYSGDLQHPSPTPPRSHTPFYLLTIINKLSVAWKQIQATRHQPENFPTHIKTCQLSPYTWQTCTWPSSHNFPTLSRQNFKFQNLLNGLIFPNFQNTAQTKYWCWSNNHGFKHVLKLKLVWINLKMFTNFTSSNYWLLFLIFLKYQVLIFLKLRFTDLIYAEQTQYVHTINSN